MKKLLVTVIGATAAIGAFAGYPLQFESPSFTVGDTTIDALNTVHGNYWSAAADATNNTYAIEAAGTVTCPTPLENAPTQSLGVKTTFTKPLSLSVAENGAATAIGDGLYFDSLVKFTVCDSAPDTSSYDGAKIVLWLQEDEDNHVTNLWVRAGYLTTTAENGVVATNYMTGVTISDTFADAWHRVTIKAIADITASGHDFPGFAIYIDKTGVQLAMPVTCDTSVKMWDSTFTYGLSEAADYLAGFNGLFPSMIQSGAAKQKLASVGFDGTGSIADLNFTNVAPDYAKDYVAPEINNITIAGTNYTTLAGAIAAVNGQGSGSFTLSLAKDMTLTETLAFASAANVVLDFAGKVLTIAGTTPAISNAGLLTITNSTVDVGGIECTASEGGVAVTDNGSGMLNFAGGFFKGHVDLDDAGTYSVYGGSFKDDETNFEYEEDEETKTWIAEGKKLEYNGETGLYDVVEATGTVIKVALTWGDFTPVSCTVNGESVTPAAEIDAEDGNEVVLTVENADGVQKSYSLTVSAEAETNAINASGWVPAWADYLGAAVDGAYQIDDANDLVMLSKGVFSGLATSGVTFKQTANIDMTGVDGFWGIGWFTSSDSKDASITASGDIPFAGTYDGQGYTISNVTIVRHNYAGVFNNVSGTVRNLTVQNLNFSGTCSEWGCAIVGNAASGSLLENLTAAASTVWGDNANHNVAGVVVRPIGAATIRGCVNNANITASGKRVGGVAAFVGSGSTGTVFDSCTNTAAIVSSNGTRGVGGILGCAEGNTTATATIIRNCADFGSETAQAEGGHAGAIVGSNWNGSYTYTDDGGNTFKASTVDCGYVKNAVFGRAYATASTISGTDYLTTVKAADLAAGNTYTLLQDIAASETPVITLSDADETIAFKLNGHSFAGTIASSHDGVTAESATADGVITYTATITDQWAYRLGAPVDGAYEIDNLAELKAFQAGVADGLTTASTTFKLTADIALTEAWEGIGVKGGKDLVNGASTKNIPKYEAGAFCGTFDGQNHTISNFQMENGTDYGAFFNSVNGATISNLKISFKEDKLCANSSSTGGDTGATFVGVARGSTLQNLTALAGSVTTVSASKDMAGIVGYLMAGSTVDSCTNELNVASLLTAKARKSGGIALITQDGSGTATIRNCKNSGTVTLANAGGQLGGIVGYVGTSTTIADCENTATVRMVTHMSGTLTMSGVNKGNATVASCNKAIDGLNFATVNGNVATFVADNALAAGNTYKVMATGATATFAFAEAGTIAFNTALATPTFAITAAEGLTLTPATDGTVTTYTAAVAGINPVDNKPVDVEATSAADATNKVVVVAPTGVDAAEYKNLFDFEVTEVTPGVKYEVSIAGIKEVVEEAVEQSAMDVLDGKTGAKVQVPAGLSYKVTTYTALGGKAVETKSGTSNGTGVEVSKPGTTQGFIKVEMGTTPYNE